MEVKTGFFYHIKDNYFNKVCQNGLMINHDNGHSRPTYLSVKDGELLWFIPISSKVSKYKKILNTKISKYGKCNTILIRKIFDEESAILIQNAFPVIEEYIDHYHIRNGKPARISQKLEKEVITNFYETLKLKALGKNYFFTDIDKLKEMMLVEINANKITSYFKHNLLFSVSCSDFNDVEKIIEVSSSLSVGNFISKLLNKLNYDIDVYSVYINSQCLSFDYKLYDIDLLNNYIQVINKNNYLILKLKFIRDVLPTDIVELLDNYKVNYNII